MYGDIFPGALGVNNFLRILNRDRNMKPTCEVRSVIPLYNETNNLKDLPIFYKRIRAAM